MPGKNPHLDTIVNLYFSISLFLYFSVQYTKYQMLEEDILGFLEQNELELDELVQRRLASTKREGEGRTK